MRNRDTGPPRLSTPRHAWLGCLALLALLLGPGCIRASSRTLNPGDDPGDPGEVPELIDAGPSPSDGAPSTTPTADGLRDSGSAPDGGPPLADLLLTDARRPDAGRLDAGRRDTLRPDTLRPDTQPPGIRFDTASSAVLGMTGPTTLSWSHTTTSAGGGTRLLVVTTGVRGNTAVTSATYGSRALTKLRSDNTAVPDARTEIWYLKDPAAGTQTVTLTFSVSQNITAGALTFTGVSQITPFNGTGAGAVISTPTTNPTISLAVPSAAGQVVVDTVTVQTPNANLAVNAAQTERWLRENQHVEGRASSRPAAASGASTTMTWTQTGVGISGRYEPYAISAVALRPWP